MRQEHMIGYVIILLLALDVYFSYKNYQANSQKGGYSD